MNTHKLKTWPEYFSKVWRGNKSAELRKNDRDFKVGDEVILEEWHKESCEYTGREIRFTISDVTEGFGLKDDYVMLSFRRRQLQKFIPVIDEK